MQTGGHEKSRPCLSCENRDSLAASKSPPFENREGRGSPLLAGAPARHEERSNCWTGIPRNATLHNRAAQGLDVRHLPSPSPCGRGEVFLLTSPFIEPAKSCSLAPMITSQNMVATSPIMSG